MATVLRVNGSYGLAGEECFPAEAQRREKDKIQVALADGWQGEKNASALTKTRKPKTENRL